MNVCEHVEYQDQSSNQKNLRLQIVGGLKLSHHRIVLVEASFLFILINCSNIFVDFFSFFGGLEAFVLLCLVFRLFRLGRCLFCLCYI